ncbi:MutS-related protein [Propionicimonas sp.]|uniref:MutS-related protein n=1 Tax=Propionicimonas sp. TaxID=1955623 RepID=UPI0039E70B7B
MCAAGSTTAPGGLAVRAGSTALGPGCPRLLGPAGRPPRPVAPQTLVDLHLDEVISAAAPGDFQRQVWREPLTDAGVVGYRQDVAADLARADIRPAAEAIDAALAAARNAILAWRSAHDAIPAELNLLESIRQFTEAVTRFSGALAESGPTSEGLLAVRAHLAAYTGGEEFRTLSEGCASRLEELRARTVELGMRAGTVWVDEDSGRPGWTAQIAAFFARFDSAASSATGVPARPRRYLNHVEAQAIGLVAELRPAVFGRLHAFAAAHQDFLPDDLARLGEELRFFLGFQKVADQLGGEGVAWCRPRVIENPGTPLLLAGTTDLALALRTHSGGARLVPNDLCLGAGERIAFVTGPNQGGKTTYARTIGQLAYLASLGLAVPARSATLPLLNPVLTHFPQPDDPEHQRGGLADELVRLRGILDAADASALLVLNELFSATSAQDALDLSRHVLIRLDELGCRALWVTFLEELVTSVEGAASLVGQLAPDDPTRPTFRFRAEPPAGRSHAAALAARHGLSADDLAGRLA